MSRNTICVAGLLVFMSGWSSKGDAHAQQLLMPRVGGYNQVQADPLPNPVVSPYLLMTDNGIAGLYNYQTLVQPLMQQRLVTNQQNEAISRLGQQVRQTQQNSGSKRSGSVRETGHESRYFNYSHYYSSGR